MASNMLNANTYPFVDEIDHREIVKKEMVGKGGFGKVHRAIWKDQNVAVKYIEHDQNHFIREVGQLSRVKHPNIVSLYGVCTQEPNVCLVMELADDGSLENLLHCRLRIKYTIGHAMSWAKQCAEGVAHLHEIKPRSIIHRDLKSSNLLIFKGGTVLKIGDFGTATEQRTLMTMNIGTIKYMAPEVFKESKYTEKCDVYSWGIILWELFTRQKPFTEFDNMFAIMLSVGSGNRPPLITEWPEPIQNLIKICWHENGAERPTMSAVAKQMLELCKFFAGGDIPLATQNQFVEVIDHHGINRIELVGKGKFGTVYKAMWNDQVVAVKYIGEIHQLNQISHPNIVHLFGACTDKANACLVMEYCEGISLYNLLHISRQIQYTTGHAMSWMEQSATAVDFLHSMLPGPIIHRNLKASNLLLLNGGTVLKVCEIDTATEENSIMAMDKGTIACMAPEVFLAKIFTEKCDVYSWGIILWEVLSRQQPFNELNDVFAIMQSVVNGNRPDHLEQRPKDIVEKLITACWDQTPANRPTMSDVVKQMLKLCIAFPVGDTPLVIPGSTLGDIID